MMKKFLFVLYALFVVHISNATIYAIDVLKKGTKTVCLFSDVHGPTQIGVQQQHQLIYWAKKLNATLIVEDSEDITPLNNEILPRIKDEFRQPYKELFNVYDQVHKNKDLNKDSLPEFLTLSQLARKNNVQLVNAEFRHFIDWDKITTRFSKIVMSVVIHNLKPCFPQGVNNYIGQLFGQIPSNKMHEELSEQQKKTLEDLTTLLLDLRLLQATKNAETDIVFVCAGAVHIEKVVKILINEGWRSTIQGGTKFATRWFRELRKQIPNLNLKDGEHYQESVHGAPQKVADSISLPINIGHFFWLSCQANSFLNAPRNQQTGLIDLGDIGDEQNTANQSSWKKWALGACGVAALGVVAYVAYKNNFGGWLKQKLSTARRFIRYLVRPKKSS